LLDEKNATDEFVAAAHCLASTVPTESTPPASGQTLSKCEATHQTPTLSISTLHSPFKVALSSATSATVTCGPERENMSAHSSSPDAHGPDSAVQVPSDVDITRPYALMIKVLDKVRTDGNARILWSALGIHLMKENPRVYEEAGVRKLKDYVMLAEARGIVKLGGSEGGAWVALQPKWYRRGQLL
jgi:hypothetical protein